MKVTLIQSTQNPKDLITRAASICYGKEEAKYPDRLLASIYNLGHHSVLEHVYFTWKIEGISRACLAQLTRHRHASFTVRSQRYCNESDQEFVYPDLEEGSIEHDIYDDVLAFIKDSYDHLIELGVKKEDARMILPNAASTELYMSCNLRELIHLKSIRTAKGAQQEIKDLVNKMIELVIELEPDLSFMFKEV